MSQPDPIDPARIAGQLDRAEQAGLIDTDVAQRLRGLVGAEQARREAAREQAARTVAEWIGDRGGLSSLLPDRFLRIMTDWAEDPAPKLPGLTIGLRLLDNAAASRCRLEMTMISGDYHSRQVIDIDIPVDRYFWHCFESCHRELIDRMRNRR
jgi:hypothetical protein